MSDEREALPDERDAFLAICSGERKPDPAAYQAGRDAHAAGKEFHEGPRPILTAEALSWRLGWNDRALEQEA